MDEVLDVEVTADGQGKHDHPGLFETFKKQNKLNIQSKISFSLSLADFETYTNDVIYEQPLIPLYTSVP